MDIKVKGTKANLVKMILEASVDGADNASPDTTTAPPPAKPATAASKKKAAPAPKKPAATKKRGRDVEEEQEEAKEEEDDDETTTTTTSTTSTAAVAEDEEEEEDEVEDAKPNKKARTTAATTTAAKTTTTTTTTTSSRKITKSVQTLGQWTQHEESFFFLEAPITRSKVAAFDMDDTMIHTKSGAKFAKDRRDWVWWDDSVPIEMKRLHDDGYQVIVITNQGGVGIKSKFDKGKFNSVSGKIQDLCKEIGIPCIAIMACDLNGEWRKPNKLMWEFLEEECNNTGAPFDASQCFYVGDAAGRPDNWKPGKKKDFANSDRAFAMTCGIAFQTPEEFFLGEQPFVDKSGAVSKFAVPQPPRSGEILEGGGNITSPKQEMIVLCGWPASGKSTFSKTHLVPAGYGWVNRDTMGDPKKCLKAAIQFLSQGKSVVIDNTNPMPSGRKEYIDAAKAAGVPVRCFHMQTPRELAEHLNYYRERMGQGKHVPGIGYATFNKNFVEPKVSEGFTEVKKVNFILNLRPEDETMYNIPKPK
ncbi:hypothetical protein SAMD00019534_010120 [Acytostelium subglobosum LB1]|uniref:hypothetical protein n=1 Tax=Acytostelium subglobosum LB1 TaxID=1410327 RepID=UPI000644880B|nr:hypothetical protein SAMD00019534_010120 [Acytostelium subglobosum LB1]GAM17837.1 hypothetical protein SAMD00019534_010120 [Acytostelium subglobosum LB1]|eukprot:XP_012758433.1 hypothetical protein SAMD00019534_010120 [Acytostelium subglobosum LB1]